MTDANLDTFAPVPLSAPLPEYRERMEFDVLIVGAGVAGLSAAITLKKRQPSLSVCVLEKGSSVGSHILSGAVMDVSGLESLYPHWKDDKDFADCFTPVVSEAFSVLSEGGDVTLPSFLLPPMLHNKGSVIVRLGRLCGALAKKAEELGVEIYTGMAASGLIEDKGRTIGVIAGEFGKDKNGEPKPSYEAGMELTGKYLLIAEGTRGFLAEKIIQTYHLSANSDVQKYALGLKEVWEIPTAKHKQGHILHTVGWPLGKNATGGGFVYHLDNNQISIGMVVHLGYDNPTLSPYDEFQRFKHHPLIADLLQGGKRLEYGARAINSGGLQSLPYLAFEGGLLLGCSAGMVNVPRIKGIHNAFHSGRIAGECVAKALKNGGCHDTLVDYNDAVRNSEISDDLLKARNIKPLWEKNGLMKGLFYGGLEMWSYALRRKGIFATLHHTKADRQTLKPLSQVKAISYPKPDGVLSFDRLTNLAFSGVHHEENQPCHLHLKTPSVHTGQNLQQYGEPARLYCPAGVYEVVYDTENSQPRFQINASNCVHCKTCDIKDPANSIVWTAPEGGNGTEYSGM